MKLTTIAIAVLGLASGLAQAQNNVVVYGVLDVGLKYEKGTTTSGGLWTEATGQRLGSRFGLRGSEELGNDLRAVYTLESGFNPDDGNLNNGGRLFGRQAWVGLEGGFGALYLGRQYSSTYLALKAIDPFKNQEAGNSQRTYGYGIGAVDPISRSDNTVTYTTPTVQGWYIRAGYKFGESTTSFVTNSSKFGDLVYEAGPWVVHASYQDTDGVSLGAATTQLGSLVAATGIGGATVRAKNSFVGAVYNFTSFKVHAAVGDTKLSALHETDLRNALLGVTVPMGRGSFIASWNRSNVKALSDGVSNQYGLGYAYALSKRTDLYSSISYTINGRQVLLNAAAKGMNEHELRAGICHSF